MIISVVGAGYVGLSLSVLISQKIHVKLFDIDKKKIDKISNNISPIKDKEIKYFLSKKKLKLSATSDKSEAYKEAKFVVIATPTNYLSGEGMFDTSSVESVISDIQKFNSKATIIIKSTIPLGFTDIMRKKYNKKNIIFSPEFLREGQALHDNLYPSRIIVGDTSNKAKEFADILVSCSKRNKKEIKIFFMNSKEAEAVKLFANTYLAMRVSYFNELDSFAQVNNISTKNIIDGVCSDERIGNYYNNPSFGYGGYCLPKDTKQLLKNFNKIPNNLIKAIIQSNKTRKRFVFESILKTKPKKVGIYRLVMKTNSDNFRESAVTDIISLLKKRNIIINIFEPNLKNNIRGTTIYNNLKEFIKKSDIILANRMTKELSHISRKVYTRDLFGEN